MILMLQDMFEVSTITSTISEGRGLANMVKKKLIFVDISCIYSQKWIWWKTILETRCFSYSTFMKKTFKCLKKSNIYIKNQLFLLQKYWEQHCVPYDKLTANDVRRRRAEVSDSKANLGKTNKI